MPHNRYQAIIDTAVDAIITADASGTVMSFNRAAEEIFGYAAGEVLGKNVSMLLTTTNRAEHEEYFGNYLGTSERKIFGIGRQVEGRRKDGSAVTLHLSIAEWRDADVGRCFTAIMRDVTEFQQAQEALRIAKEQAESAMEAEAATHRKMREAYQEMREANEALQRFTSIAAHDLRAPLKRIEAFIGALRDDYASILPEDGADMLIRVERGAGRMRLMLDSLLDYSKFSGHTIKGKEANLDRVICDALEAFELEKIGAQVRVALNGQSHVRGDPVLLTHVLQNLIGNAIKFRREVPPVIDIRAEPAGDYVQLSVADNGIGIEPRFADKIFQMFYRLHDEDEYEGTGIGLTVSKKIVNDHGGNIWLDTGYSNGTRIFVTLQPADEAKPAQDASGEYGGTPGNLYVMAAPAIAKAAAHRRAVAPQDRERGAVSSRRTEPAHAHSDVA